ncbi:hypothetical protein ACLB2K_059628 [Fragaria x ananassa]
MARNEEMSSMNEDLQHGIEIHEESSKEELFKNIEEAESRLAQLQSSKPKLQSSKPKLQKVPVMLRDHTSFEKYYEPRAVAIGPFHHAKERCQLAEKFKLALTAKFVKDSGCPAEVLHKIIEDNINTLRDCYDEEATRSYTDESLTQLLFLDGCSTLQFIYSFMHNELPDFQIKRDQVAFAQQDLFLLENQLPYQVLKLLMNKSHKKEELNNAIHEFVRDNIMAATKKGRKHISVRQPEDRINIEEVEEPTHLLELLRTEMLGPKDDGNEIWIQLKPSKTSTLKDISFKSLGFVGFLHLPPISVDDSMGPKFLNLIAYEMCPDFKNDFEVTSYICLLDSLIDHADDVKELRSADVLYNLLGSDEEVARLFNEIALGLSSIQTWYTITSPPSACDAVCEYLKKQLKIE